MKKDPDQNSADSAEIEALIARIERGQLRDGDAQLLTRLLRLLLRLITLLQQKNASLSRLKRLLFGPRSDKRREANSSPGSGAEGESDSESSTSTENSSPDTPKGSRSQSPSRKGGHGRMGAEAYTGARVVRCRDEELKRAVLLRKNTLFYKNEHGASVGAILQSLIETCRLNTVRAWDIC